MGLAGWAPPLALLARNGYQASREAAGRELGPRRPGHGCICFISSSSEMLAPTCHPAFPQTLIAAQVRAFDAVDPAMLQGTSPRACVAGRVACLA